MPSVLMCLPTAGRLELTTPHLGSVDITFTAGSDRSDHVCFHPMAMTCVSFIESQPMSM